MSFITLNRKKINGFISKTKSTGEKISVEFFLIPYFVIKRSNGTEEINIFIMLKEGNLFPFKFFTGINPLDVEEDVAQKIKETLNSETFNSFSDITLDQIDEHSYYLLNTHENEEGKKAVSGACFCFFYLGSSESSDFKDIIMSFIYGYQKKLKNTLSIEGLNSNLIYISARKLFEVCNGQYDEKGVYTVFDRKTGKNNYSLVSEGVISNEEISTLYNKRRQINFNGSNKDKATYPPKVLLYGSPPKLFASQFLNVSLYGEKFRIPDEESDYFISSRENSPEESRDIQSSESEEDKVQELKDSSNDSIEEEINIPKKVKKVVIESSSESEEEIPRKTKTAIVESSSSDEDSPKKTPKTKTAIVEDSSSDEESPKKH